MLDDITFWKDMGDAFESFATALALVLGGIWTYLAFIRQRLALPRLDVSLTVEKATIAQSLLIRAQVSLRNSGSVVVASNIGEIRLRQIVPPPREIEEAVASGFDPVPSECAQVEWPMLAGREWKWRKGEFEIEPGESDSLYADFFVPRDTQVVELYFFLANAHKKSRNLGWSVSHLYHLSRQGGLNALPTSATQTPETAATEAAG